MKVVAAIDVDLESTPLGTASRQEHLLAGRPVLRRCVERVLRAQRPAGVNLLCPEAQAARCAALVQGLAVTIRPKPAAEPPCRRLTRTARKWSLDGWRGGLGGATSLDEYTDCAALACLGADTGADGIWVCSGAAAVVDPALIDAMIAHYERVGHAMRMTFAAVPPGLAGVILETALLADLARQRIPPGWLLSYKPDAPQMDLVFKDCSYPAPQPMLQAAGRLVVDTLRAEETVAVLLAEHPDPDGEAAARWLLRRVAEHVSALPREVEIELTTEDQNPETPLRPRGSQVGRRGPIDLEVVTSVARSLAAYDDSLVVLGGFGEPLLHPRFDEICRLLSESGVYGLAVRTNGRALDDDRIDALVRRRVDVLNVMLDAWTDDQYRRLHPGHEMATVLAALDRLAAARSTAKQAEPIVVPQLTKSLDTVEELEAFFDGWVRKTGCAVIEGYSHHAGQLPDRSVTDMSPPTRAPCRRIRSRCLILADGRMTLCDQDFRGLTAVGSLHEATLADLWRGPSLEAARRAHAEARYDALPLCPACNEWHRP